MMIEIDVQLDYNLTQKAKGFGQLAGNMLTTSRLVLILVLLLMMSTFILPTAWASADLKAGIEYTRGSYRVGPGDVLSLFVYNQPDLTQKEILVRDDGYASFNGVGEIPVAGKTLGEIKTELNETISELIIDPMITVNVTQMRPGTVYLAGAVKRPGMFQMTGSSAGQNGAGQGSARMELRLSNVLAHAGGVALNADLTRVEVHQAGTGEIIVVNLWNMLKFGDRRADVLIQSGDSIYVPGLDVVAHNTEDYDLLLRSSIGPKTFPVRVIGEVGKPGIYELDGHSPFLNTALAQAGGYKDSANRKLLAVRRFEGNQIETLYLDPGKEDIVLRPNDIVFVSEKGMHKAGRFFENVARILSPFNSLASTAFSFALMSSVGGQ